MGQREVTEDEMRAARDEARVWLDARDPERWWAYRRDLKDGRVMYLHYQGRGMSIGFSRNATTCTFDATYDYFHSANEGWRAALGWDGEGEPDGWCRARRDGDTAYRRRPDGDATKEFEAP